MRIRPGAAREQMKSMSAAKTNHPVQPDLGGEGGQWLVEGRKARGWGGGGRGGEAWRNEKHGERMEVGEEDRSERGEMEKLPFYRLRKGHTHMLKLMKPEHLLLSFPLSLPTDFRQNIPIGKSRECAFSS